MKRRLNDPPPIRRPKPAAAVKTDVPIARRKKKDRKPHGGRWEILNHFVDHQMSELTPTQRAVWFCIFRDEKNGITKTGQSDIARRCSLSRESVNRAISQLEARGLIKTLRQGGMNRGMSWYQIQAENRFYNVTPASH